MKTIDEMGSFIPCEKILTEALGGEEPHRNIRPSWVISWLINKPRRQLLRLTLEVAGRTAWRGIAAHNGEIDLASVKGKYESLVSLIPQWEAQKKARNIALFESQLLSCREDLESAREYIEALESGTLSPRVQKVVQNALSDIDWRDPPHNEVIARLENQIAVLQERRAELRIQK